MGLFNIHWASLGSYLDPLLFFRIGKDPYGILSECSVEIVR